MRLIKTAKLRKRGKSYYAEYTDHQGRRPRPSLGSDRMIAERLLVRINDWLIEGKDPIKELKKLKQRKTSESVTLRQFYPEFMQKHGKGQSKNMQELFYYCWKNIERCGELVDIPMAEITKGLVLSYMRYRVDKEDASNATANREAAMIRNMLNRAADWGILQYNPIQGLKLLKEKPKRDVRITVDQARALVSALPSPLDNIVEFAIYTGLRKENILSLRIDQVEIGESARIRVTQKGGKPLTIPINQHAANLFKRVIGERTTGYVFINPKTDTRYKSINRTFDRTVRKLGLEVNGEKLRFHDLRHVFATWLADSGVPLTHIQILLGHTDIKTTDRYINAGIEEAGRGLIHIPCIS